MVEEECKDDNQNSIKIKEVEPQNNHLESEATQTISLEEFLSQQENKIEIENTENIEQLIKAKQSIDILHEELEREIDNDEKDEWDTSMWNRLKWVGMETMNLSCMSLHTQLKWRSSRKRGLTDIISSLCSLAYLTSLELH